MHILHVIDSLVVGGAERMLVDIANCTLARGVRVSVCQTRAQGLLTDRLSDDICLLTLNRKKRFEYAALRTFAEWIRQQSVTILHVHGRSSLQFVLFVKFIIGMDFPIIFHDHYGRIAIDDNTPLWFKWLTNNNILMYVGVSEELAQWALKSGINSKKIRTVENYLDFERFEKSNRKNIRDEWQFDITTKLGVVVCGLRHEKGIHVLIRALSLLGNEKTKIIVFGGEVQSGYLSYCQDLSKALRVQDKIVFAGQRTDIPDFLKSFDFAVVPSISESGPLVLIEYLAYGLPVVATRTGEISLSAEKSGAGRFVDPGDADGLADALRAILKLSPRERADIGAADSAVAWRNYDMRSKITIWLDLYSKAAEGIL